MVRAKTRKEIANEFGINRKTLYRWLKSENIELKKRLVTPDEQAVIYKMFGYPDNLLFKKDMFSHNMGRNVSQRLAV